SLRLSFLLLSALFSFQGTEAIRSGGLFCYPASSSTLIAARHWPPEGGFFFFLYKAPSRGV
ncbi:MAG: hypothetical protein ACLTEG_12525, partial [Acutalibacter sp.]